MPPRLQERGRKGAEKLDRASPVAGAPPSAAEVERILGSLRAANLCSAESLTLRDDIARGRRLHAPSDCDDLDWMSRTGHATTVSAGS